MRATVSGLAGGCLVWGPGSGPSVLTEGGTGPVSSGRARRGAVSGGWTESSASATVSPAGTSGAASSGRSGVTVVVDGTGDGDGAVWPRAGDRWTDGAGAAAVGGADAERRHDGGGNMRDDEWTAACPLGA